MGVAGDRASRGHLIGIHDVILAVTAESDTRDHGNAALLPYGFNPARLNRRHFADEAKVVAIGSLLARAKSEAVATTHAHCRLMHAGKGRDELLVHMACQNHYREVARLCICNAETVNEFAHLANLAQ